MMSIQKTIFLIFTLALLGHALHLHEVSSSYITYLQNQQNTVKGKLDSMAEKLSQNYKAV